MTTDGSNVELLASTLAWAKTHPEEHDQQNWAAKKSCGTSYCIAGHIAVMLGHELVWQQEDDFGNSFAAYVKGGKLISNVAREGLGISCPHSEWLFDSGNTLEDLYDIASQLTGGAIPAYGWKD